MLTLLLMTLQLMETGFEAFLMKEATGLHMFIFLVILILKDLEKGKSKVYSMMLKQGNPKVNF